MKKKNNNKLVRTTFVVLDREIAKGESLAYDAWVSAGVECVAKCGGNASLYTKSAVWDATRKGKNTLTQTDTTIRLYVSAVVRLLKKYKTRSALLAAYDAVYESREISALLAFAKTGKNGKSKKKKSNANAVALTKRQARKAYDESKSFDEFWELING